MHQGVPKPPNACRKCLVTLLSVNTIQLQTKNLKFKKNNLLFQMMKNVGKEQADRIFRSCDTSGDNKISLEEFRTKLSKADDKEEK